MRLRLLFISLGFSIALAGCGQRGSNAFVPQTVQPAAVARLVSSLAADSTIDTVPNVSGTYTGTIDDEHDGAGTLTIVIDQTKAAISGTFTPHFKDGGKTFPLSGKVWVRADKTHVKFTASGSDCTATVKGIVSGGHLNGSYTVACTTGKDTKGTYKTKT